MHACVQRPDPELHLSSYPIPSPRAIQAPQEKGFFVLNDILRISPSDPTPVVYSATPIAAPIIPHANGNTAVPAAYLVGVKKGRGELVNATGGSRSMRMPPRFSTATVPQHLSMHANSRRRPQQYLPR